MLSKNTVLRTRKAIEMSYDFRADIFEKKKVVVSSVTNFKEVMVQSDVCCRLSYSNISSNSENEADSNNPFGSFLTWHLEFNSETTLSMQNTNNE